MRISALVLALWAAVLAPGPHIEIRDLPSRKFVDAFKLDDNVFRQIDRYPRRRQRERHFHRLTPLYRAAML